MVEKSDLSFAKKLKNFKLSEDHACILRSFEPFGAPVRIGDQLDNWPSLYTNTSCET